LEISAGDLNTKIQNLTALPNINNTSSLDSYVEFPILKGTPKKSENNFVIEKMKTRLTS